MINKLDTKAEERFQEREERRLEIFLDAEEERRRNQHEEYEEMRKLEREHEECMQGMFMGYTQQMMSMLIQPPAAPYSLEREEYPPIAYFPN